MEGFAELSIGVPGGLDGCHIALPDREAEGIFKQQGKRMHAVMKIAFTGTVPVIEEAINFILADLFA